MNNYWQFWCPLCASNESMTNCNGCKKTESEPSGFDCFEKKGKNDADDKN